MSHYRNNEPDVHIDIRAIHGNSKVVVNKERFSALITEAVKAAMDLRKVEHCCNGHHCCIRPPTVQVNIEAVHDHAQVIIQ